ncbi:TlpA family protein disulfide reductase [Sphingobacterium sp. UDSM-2020]|uniref:TlpA family protein disulfide reductase n=1 Tax=Sphingobacterium sp. UDSM-2020 TaxID=2795738 RepID=UPI001935FDA8|nr:TlpA disulfide reductase family protein [Sphingobacterium sp. UDSM-2020]QQD14261.1 TlpA family protein disulfide reductase [Sphingobacterium sp. UDSM-2020]
MKYIILNMLLLTVAWKFSYSQQKEMDRSKQLHVGEVLPKIRPMSILNFNTKSVHLQDWKDKVVVLEFFDTFCASCIEGMPALAQVQKEMGDKLVVLLVTWQSKEVIEKFYRTNAFLKEKNVKLPTIVGDTLLRQFFPHQGVPHTVFLYKGKVHAITYPDYVKKQFIEELYTSGKLRVPQKDQFKKGDLSDIITEEDNFIGSVRLTAYQEELVEKPGLSIEKDSISGMYRTYFSNVGILNAYKALDTYIKKPKFLLTDKRIVWKVKDPEKYYYREGGGGQQLWLTKYGICYERKSYVAKELAELATMAINDLNTFLGLRVYWDQLERDCLVIQKIGSPNTGRTPKEKVQKMENLSVLIFLMDYSGKYLPIVDESDYKGNIELVGYQNIADLNEQLQSYGLEMVEGKRKIEMLIVEEIQ